MEFSKELKLACKALKNAENSFNTDAVDIFSLKNSIYDDFVSWHAINRK